MDKILKKAAEILVESGYAMRLSKCRAALRAEAPEWHDNYDATHVMKSKNNFNYPVDPFADTLEGRRQLDVIEDWLENSVLEDDDASHRVYDLWLESAHEIACESNHQWRLDRIKWCLEQLGETDQIKLKDLL